VQELSPVHNSSAEAGIENVVRAESVPFARSKLFAVLGTGLAGLSARLVDPESASAWHGFPPGPDTVCFGFGVCHCCSGSICCESSCTWPGGAHTHCPSGQQCWYSCWNHENWRCCDWHVRDSAGTWRHCICTGKQAMAC
jgi:hypothetical protein